MTTPAERARSIDEVRQFLYDIADFTKYPRIPKTIRQRALGCLKHYPWATEVHMMRRGVNLLEEKLEPGEEDPRD
jgi:hypothetical protein